MSDISIENVAAVERLKIPMPDGGGLVVLTGDNGAGKTKSLEAIDAVLGGDVKSLQKRDQSRGGTIDGFGVTIRVGARSRKVGELTVASLEDRLSIADLVDPGIKDPVAADRHRLKALLRVSGVPADLSLFAELLPELRAYVTDATVAESDLVAMAARVKRDLEAAARDLESTAEAHEREAASLLDTIRDVDLKAPASVEIAQEALDKARRDADQLEFRVKAGQSAAARVAKARADLATAEASYKGPTAEEAIRSEERARDEVGAIGSTVLDLERQLEDARARHRDALSVSAAATQTREAAENHERLCRAWRETLDSADGAADMPTEARLADAKAAVERAQQELANAGIVARAMQQAERAKQLRVGSVETQEEAAAIRKAASGTDSILTAAVQRMGGEISVGEDDKGQPRLLVQHPKRGETYFSELSSGERWSAALPIAINAVGPGGVFTIRQEAWEGLSPANRTRLVNALKGSGVTAITAQADDGPIRAELVGEEGGAE